MKVHFITIYFFLLALTTLQLSAQIKKIPRDSIPATTLLSIHDFAFDTYNSCESKIVQNLTTDRATPAFIKNYKKDKVISNCSDINKISGKLKQLILQEVLKDSNQYIFRYKALYAKTDDVREVRVYTDSALKLNGITHNAWFYQKYHKFGEQATFYKLDSDTLNKRDIDNAYHFASQTFKNCNAGRFLKLTTQNATMRLQKSLTNQKLEQSCNKIYAEFGNLLLLNLSEVISDGYRIIYRYKAKYEKSENWSEIVVMTTFEHKFGGIYMHDIWSDIYKENRE